MRYRAFSICIFFILIAAFAGICSAQSSLQVSESTIRIQFLSDGTAVNFPVLNTTRIKLSAHVLLELIDTQGKLQSHAERDVSLPAGMSKLAFALPQVTSPKNEPPRLPLLWYRLRYTITQLTPGRGEETPLTGVISVSEAPPQFFELHVAAPEHVKTGERYFLRVRAIHPAGSAVPPSPGADVDRDSVDRAMQESGWVINQYDILPDRLVVYLWPHAGGTKFTFSFKPRFGLRAQSASSVLYDYYNPEARAVVAPTHFVVQ